MGKCRCRSQGHFSINSQIMTNNDPFQLSHTRVSFLINSLYDKPLSQPALLCASAVGLCFLMSLRSISRRRATPLTQHRFAFFDDAFGRPPKLILLFIQMLNAFRAVLAKHIPGLFAREKGRH
jgi:hypothetical protein